MTVRVNEYNLFWRCKIYYTFPHVHTMSEIYDFTKPYPFTEIDLTSPLNKGGAYFMKMTLKEAPIYLQSPKCLLKQGFFKSSKKMYCDLIFTGENEKFIHWVETLEQTCCKRIYENRSKWFENDLEEHDIENYMTSPFKIYKSGKMYVLRVLVPTVMESCDLKVYDENEKEIDHSDLKENTEVITILEFKGIRCSVRNFQFEIEVKQMLVLVPSTLFKKCIIQHNSSHMGGGGGGGDLNVFSEKNNNKLQVNGSDAERVSSNNDQQTKIESEVDVVVNNTEIMLSQTSAIETAPSIIKTNSEKRPDLESEEPSILEKENHLVKARENIENMTANETHLLNGSDGLVEVDFNLDELENEKVVLKERNDVYYKMYKDAKRKAKEAKIIALSNYLEAKRIKATYLLEESDSEESDLEDFEKPQTN